MALRGSSCCNPNTSGCGNDNPCYWYTSNIRYDGEDIPEAGVRHNDTLNSVISNLAKYIVRGINSSGAIKMDEFTGVNNVRLGSDPAEVLQVSYCGGVLPPEFYKVSGRNVYFCKDFCKDDEFASVQVIYREKADTTYGFNC